MAGKDVYAASCNPPRGAKQRPRSQSESSSASEYTPEPRRVVPLSSKISKAAMDHTDAEPPTTGAKRGRKPATLSRTAREAQRKLNHSIIEKARRTKINDALATLKQLVPAKYGQTTAPAEDEDEGADGDYEGRNGGKTAKKSTGKREEKEKEFKLEILIRTVSFMQDLIARVAVLEGAEPGCSNCAGPSTLKRKRSEAVADAEEESRPVPKRREAGPATPEPSLSPEFPSMAYSGARLPSISSWLPNLSQIDPSLRPSPSASPQFQSHLPSPPSSTQFAASRPPSQLPPALSLGPVATQARLSARTLEDESAASLLLEISASSPTFHETRGGVQRQVQTPASLLGLNAKR
ncbi:hypothetical protein DFH09DRAFT_1279860 [Mycena vulgaris]|nr:hypothetical protein DFH09DRAFT_1279860 [Mycena vulgaris]